MHAISQVHFEGRHLTRVRLHEVGEESSCGFGLNDGRDVPVAEVVQLLRDGNVVRIAVVDAGGAFLKGGFVTRDFEGTLLSLPLFSSNATRLEALPRY